jgi:hypothetical protein
MGDTPMWDAIGSVVLILVILFAMGVEERLGLTWKWPRKDRMGDAEIARKAREFADLKWMLRAKGLPEDEAHKAAYEAVIKG